MPTLLICLLVLPFATALLVALLGPGRGDAVRRTSLGSTLVSLVLSIVVAANFAGLPRVREATFSSPLPASAEFKPELGVAYDLLPLQRAADGAVTSAIQFFIGVDGLNIWLVVLTALLMVSSVLISWNVVRERTNEFYAWLLALQTGLVGVFLSFDIILFYVFFELTLVPLFFLIGIWGGPQRQYAARKFFIYTLTGSLITLLGVLGIVYTLSQELPERGTTFAIPRLAKNANDLSALVADEVAAREKKWREATDETERKQLREDADRAEGRAGYWRKVQFWVFLAMMIGFAIKVPLFPLHTWLPLAHTEAPTAGSVLLAGVLLKIGAYGFLRLCVPLAPDASLSFGAPLIGSLAVVGILYGAFCAYAQEDFKKLVAYSSVSHLGYCMLGLFALNEVGLTGSLFQMINHGLSTGALFLLVGMLYERYHTRKMSDYGGMGARLKMLSVCMVFITMSSIGLPGLNGFWGEISVLMGMYWSETAAYRVPLLVGFATFGSVLSALYMLTLLRRMFFGPVKEPHHDGPGHAADMNGREWAALAPIAAVCLFLGVYPLPFLDSIRADVRVVARYAEDARDRARQRQPVVAAEPARTASVK